MSRLDGTAPPICTVTVIVCGASVALGSVTDTMPVEIPAGRLEVFKTNCSGVQTPGRDEQLRCAPTEPPIQETEDASFRASAPSASLYASTVWVCSGLPLTPCAIETGPIVDDTRRNRGAALRPATKKKAAAKT